MTVVLKLRAMVLTRRNLYRNGSPPFLHAYENVAQLTLAVSLDLLRHDLAFLVPECDTVYQSLVLIHSERIFSGYSLFSLEMCE